jgi:hypothetical protein
VNGADFCEAIGIPSGPGQRQIFVPRPGRTPEANRKMNFPPLRPGTTLPLKTSGGIESKIINIYGVFPLKLWRAFC